MDENNYLEKYINWRLNGIKDIEINNLVCLHFYFRYQESLRIKLYFQDYFNVNKEEKSVNQIELNYTIEDDSIGFGYGDDEEEEETLKNKPLISDQENKKNNLIIGLAIGEKSSFESLYKTEFYKILDYVKGNSGTRTEAEDVFQDGIMILLEKIKTPGFEFTCNVGTYLYSCCKNIWLKKLQKSKRELSIDFFDVYHFVEIEVYDEPEDLEEKLNVILSQLSESCLKVIKAFYYDLKSWDIIASELGYTSANSAKNQKYKCMQKILENKF